ncbi:thiamine-phosphate pyrophosphorylase [Lentibacillus halodurans]|uniref:Thiamine-phosphate synthase n=1 Tax=Lentibacillus halodurans TaxID=237679 RepID=A0A1I0Y1W7_9BACI|nr:thiamine phosphate synthase [Lentibacillus halodurans]SFB06610.1 thiamine-phosphate pyrophosphorylase [Lentibacillus halodurans]
MNLRKYFIMGSQNCDHSPEDILEEAAKAGITAFQFREKGGGSLTGQDKLALGYRLRNICARHHVLFFVNDDIDLAEPLEADGIHVGQDDMRPEKVKEMYPNKIIGLSVSNQKEVENSPIQLADYLGAGPIFTTSTKEDAKQAVGTEWIKTLKQQYPGTPIVGIGGITEQNAAFVMEAGADGVAVISAIAGADNIETVIRRL